MIFGFPYTLTEADFASQSKLTFEGDSHEIHSEENGRDCESV